MRFLKVAVVALALVGSLVGGVSAKKHHNKPHHQPLFSKTAPTLQEFEDLFTSWMKQYNKKYSHAEFSSRFQIFKANFEHARIHNTMKNSTYTLGINEHSDLTPTEFKAKYFGYKPRNNEFLRSKNYPKFDSNVKAPASVDWRNSNAVTPVKNQGQCGACWAFSTTGSTEGAHAIATGTLVSLSEQQLVDCAGAEGNQGCNGGLMDDGFQYIIDNKGLCGEDVYPYTAADGTCNTNGCTVQATISSFTNVPQGDETTLLTAVAQQPVSIAIEADQADFQAYSGGVFSASDCGTQLDHGVLIVGYGTDPTGGDYWIVKNSWGASWGESGYIRLIRGQNQCGLANQASYPVV